MAEYEIQAPDGRIVTLQGDTPPTDADLDEIFANLSEPLTASPEAQAEVSQRNADYEAKYNDVGTLDKLKQGLSQFTGQDVLDVAGQSLQGAERVASGATLGGYDLANRLLGGNYAERKQELANQAEQAGIGGLNTATGLGLEMGGNIAGAGKALLGGLSRAGLKGATLPIAASAVEGATYGATGAERLSDLPKDVLTGGAIGAVIPAALKGTGSLLKGGLGMTSGVGGSALEQAFDAGKRKSTTFLDNLRGKAPSEDVILEAKASVDDLRKGASIAYAENMGKVKTDKAILDVNPVFDEIGKLKDDLTVGGFSKADKGTRQVIKDVDDIMSEFSQSAGLNGENVTVELLDALKQRIGDISVNMEQRGANRYKTQVYNAIKGQISKQAPEYDRIMKDYSQASELIKELEGTLSLGKKANPDTALRKLQSIFRNNVNTNYGRREALLDELGSTPIKDALAGQQLSSATPRGLSQIGTLAAGYGSLTNPAFLAALPISSPRILGEASYGLGRGLGKIPANESLLGLQTLINNGLQNE